MVRCTNSPSSLSCAAQQRKTRPKDGRTVGRIEGWDERTKDTKLLRVLEDYPTV